MGACIAKPCNNTFDNFIDIHNHSTVTNSTINTTNNDQQHNNCNKPKLTVVIHDEPNTKQIVLSQPTPQPSLTDLQRRCNEYDTTVNQLNHELTQLRQTRTTHTNTVLTQVMNILAPLTQANEPNPIVGVASSGHSDNECSDNSYDAKLCTDILQLLYTFAAHELQLFPNDLDDDNQLDDESSNDNVHTLTSAIHASNLDQTTKQWLTNEFIHQHTIQQSISNSAAEHKNSLFTQVTIDPSLHPIKMQHEFGTYEFNVFDLSTHELQYYVIRMYNEFGLIERFSIDTQQLTSFIHSVYSGYNPTNKYHNYYHAVDIMHVIYTYLHNTTIIHSTGMTKLDLLILLTSALCHDIGHTGTTNAYLCQSAHEYALIYNDISVLENLHASRAWKLLTAHGILNGLNKPDQSEFRQQMIQCILATDMTHHFTMLSKLDSLFDRLDTAQTNHTNTSREDINLLMQVLLHSADVSNVTKPYHLAIQWSERVQEEFFWQGDLERTSHTAISPFCDRYNDAHNFLPSMTINFIDFIVAPLMYVLIHGYNTLHPIAQNLTDNRQLYHNQVNQRLGIQINESTDDTVRSNKQQEQLNLQQRAQKFYTTFTEPLLIISRDDPIHSINTVSPSSAPTVPVSPAHTTDTNLSARTSLGHTLNAPIGQSRSSRRQTWHNVKNTLSSVMPVITESANNNNITANANSNIQFIDTGNDDINHRQHSRTHSYMRRDPDTNDSTHSSSVLTDINITIDSNHTINDGMVVNNTPIMRRTSINTSSSINNQSNTNRRQSRRTNRMSMTMARGMMLLDTISTPLLNDSHISTFSHTAPLNNIIRGHSMNNIQNQRKSDESLKVAFNNHHSRNKSAAYTPHVG